MISLGDIMHTGLWLGRTTLMLVALVALWLAVNHYVATYLVPTPMQVLAAIRDAAGSLPYDIIVTSVETVIGLALAAGISFGLGLLFYFWTPIEGAVMPYAVALKS